MSRDEQDAADLDQRGPAQDKVRRIVTGANMLTLFTILSPSQHCHWSQAGLRLVDYFCR